MDFETIRYEAADGRAVITLDRPERLNAINGQMSRELPLAWEEAKRDPTVRVIIVTGAGQKALSTGGDVSEVADGTAQVGEDEDQGTLASLKLTALQNRCWKPVITAVNGMAVGGGLHFVADSDIVICSETATFFDTHVRVGLIAGLEPICLARRIRLETVMRMALSGGRDRMGAQRALEVGLVSEVVAPEQLLARAHELASLVAANSPAALAATMATVPSAGLLIGGLFIFAVVLAINSALHSYLIVAYSDVDKVALNVGFYYMANAMGRLGGTLLSGLVFQMAGLSASLWVSAVMVAAAVLFTLPLAARPRPSAREIVGKDVMP